MNVYERLENEKVSIIKEWEELVRKRIPDSHHIDEIILHDHIPEMLTHLSLLLRGEELDEIELGKAHGFQRAVLTKISIKNLLDEFALLRTVLIDHLYPMEGPHTEKLIHKFIDLLLRNSVIQFINTLPFSSRIENDATLSVRKEIRDDSSIRSQLSDQ